MKLIRAISVLSALCALVPCFQVDAVASIPCVDRAVPSKSFGQTLQATKGLECVIMDEIENILGGIQFECNPANYKSLSFVNFEPPTQTVNGIAYPYVVADKRPLPTWLPGSISESEGGTLYWYFQMLRKFESYVTCSPSLGGRAQFFPPAGWKTVAMFNIINPTNNAPQSAPFIVAIANDAISQLSILLRGTMFAFEWDIDFKYDLITTSTFPGQTHQGFTNTFDFFWPQIKTLLDTRFLTKEFTKLTIAGHSLGAGVGQLLTYAVQNYVTASGLRTVVSGLFYAPPNAGNPTFVSSFNQIVNGRRVLFEFDLIPQVPCVPRMANCSNTAFQVSLSGTNLRFKPSGEFIYDSIGGGIKLLGANMPVQTLSWASMTYIPFCSAKDAVGFLTASHICSYLCYFSQFVNNPMNSCLLKSSTNATELASNTYCGRFPIDTGYPPLTAPGLLTTLGVNGLPLPRLGF